MADWGMGATSKKHATDNTPKWRMTFLVCSRCGNSWFLKHLYDSDLRHVEDEFGEPVCQRCRKKEPPRRKGTPPPPELQIMIDEVLNTKK